MKKFVFISTIVLGLATASCDSYLDINQDPNSPSESMMTTDVMLPAAEMNLVSSYGDFARITGGYFAQYYAQTFSTSNYVDFSQFKMSATRSSGFYTQMTSRSLGNLKTILVAEDEESNYELVRIVLQKRYRLIRAHNGIEAVTLNEDEK